MKATNRKELDKCMSKWNFTIFEDDKKSSFKYWFNHWKAFNLTAFYLGVWKLKYLLHDIEKPWLKLFLPYSKVQKFHRRNNSHHLEYKKGFSKMNWEATVIDNECSRFTKKNAALNSKEWYDLCLEIGRNPDIMIKYYFPELIKLNLNEI